ncbi:MAG: 16S rRNA (cytidine(1402)-2'-O)-methyltransferase [Myxococcales bacterium]|nr:16S rRNA (cytidine(1402)-2'-O)-methyltransferase [Myxococcales bacterium]
MSARLLLIATPIGNPEDITLRALRALREVDELYAEDTRVTADLLRHHGIARATRSCHDHNEDARADEIVAHLEAGRTVGVVSDAGTPLISDPGFRVVARVRGAGFGVDVLPGACAAVAALIGSGLPTDQFAFGGFLPASGPALRARLAELAGFDGTLVFYESPRRLGATLDVFAAVWPDRQVVVARNLTKDHEQWISGTAVAARAALAAETRGEVVLLVGRGAPEAVDPDTRILSLLAEGMDAKQVRDVVAAQTGLPRREIYARILTLRG